MKNQFVKFISVVLCTGLVLTGCANTEALESNQSSENQQVGAGKEKGQGKEKKNQNKQPKFNASGEISLIDGTKVTLKMIEQKKAGEGTVNKERTFKANRDKTKPGVKASPAADASPKPSKDPAQKTPKERAYTGEVKVIDLVNIPIQKMDATQEEKTPVDVVINELKVGDVIQLIYADEAKTTLERVILGGGGNAKGGKGNNGGNGGNGKKGKNKNNQANETAPAGE